MQLDDSGKRKFLFGFEESCGYLRGTHCRDKDAVVASMLFAEMVCYYTYNKIGVYQRLQELYAKYGYVYDTNVSIKYSGLNAMKEMNAVVDKMKTVEVKEIASVKVDSIRDYSKAEKRLADGSVQKIDSAKTNAVYYELEGGSFIRIRPSGTEPKLKVYYSVKAENEQLALEKFNEMKTAFESLMK